ncbi:uncharacterized protein LOC127240700 [Andrographis paniculata]|uniref:uncharacterized protein LOC127240700 n=1 Tax=Andrographis paniculata TaxID=175694 RepID=UPI0021E78F2D|nr:uncharacterized protein LOC127240700 [Andrographis paniculata]
MAMTAANAVMPTMLTFSADKSRRQRTGLAATTQKHVCIRPVSVQKSLEELYNVKVERRASKERLAKLGVSRWSVWKTGKCKLPWDWQADQLVYIEEGEVRVVPEGSERYMRFVAGDLVRYPKWFEADLFFNDFYQERYSFRAYGDDY